MVRVIRTTFDTTTGGLANTEFRNAIPCVDVLASALRHGVEPEDIQHAVTNALAVDQVGEDPDCYLILGPGRAANLLELVVLERPDGPGRHPRQGDASPVPPSTARRELTTT